MQKTLEEKLAEFAHEIWSEWMIYMYNTLADPKYSQEYYHRKWKKQADTLYNDLTEEEKESDRVIAQRIIKILSDYK